MPALKPFIIPCFIPHAGCPHRCLFCNQAALTRPVGADINDKDFKRHIRQYLAYKGHRRGTVQIAFFGGNFLGLEPAAMRRLLDLGRAFVRDGQADGLRFSTRPDTVDEPRLNLIEGYPLAAVELGVQSMDDEVLALSRRGHTAGDTTAAARLLRQRGYALGLQMMVGLPGDDEGKAIATACRIADLRPDFVRIYPTLVLAGSGLEKAFRRREYVPWTLARTVDLARRLYLFFERRGIAVIRMGVQPTIDLESGGTVVAGPYHPAFGHLVLSAVYLEKALERIAAAPASGGACIRIEVHPNCVPAMRGHGNRNIEVLAGRFPGKKMVIAPRAEIAPGDVAVQII